MANEAVLAWAAPLKASTTVMYSTGWDFQLHCLIPPGDPVGVMSKQVISRDQPIVKKRMDYFKMEIASMALPMLSQTI